jgi:hypothetical protein
MGKDRGGKKDGGMGGGDAHQKKRKGEGGGGKGDAKVQKLGGWHPKMLALKSGGGAPENGKVECHTLLEPSRAPSPTESF